MKKVLCVIHLAIFVLCYCLGAQAQTQVVMSGQGTKAVAVPGGCTYVWTNNNPAIGLPASGIGEIPSFTGINTGSSNAYATVTATPVTPLIYIPIYATRTIKIISSLDNTLVTNITVGSYPLYVTSSANGTRVYVTGVGKTYVINTSSLTVIDSINTALPGPVAASLDGKKLYVAAEYGSNPGLIVINTADKSQGTVYINDNTPNPRAFIGGIVVNADDSKVYASFSITDTIAGTTASYVDVFSTAGNAFTNKITVPVNPQSMVLNGDGSLLYVAGLTGIVTIIDTKANSITGTIKVGNGASGIVISPDGSKLFVTNTNDQTVSIIDITSAKVTATIKTGLLPTGISINPTGSKIYIINRASSYITQINATDLSTNNIDVGGKITAPWFGNFITGNTSCNPITVNYIITPKPSTPTIVKSGTNVALTTTQGKASASTSVSVQGYKLTAGITVTPPTGFEVSTDNITFSPSVTIGTGGDIAATTIYTRLAASTPVGNYSGNITFSSSPATSQTAAVSGSVSPAGAAVANQTVYNNSATQTVALPGSSCFYDWTTDKSIGLTAGNGTTIPSFTAVNTGTTPITATVSVMLSNSVFNATAAWIVNRLSGKVWVYNVPTNDNPYAVTTGADPYGVIVNKARTKGYITNRSSGTVTVIKESYALVIPPDVGYNNIATINVGKYPEGLALSPDESKLYVANSGDGTISVINPATNAVSGTINVSALNISGLAISADGSKLYVTVGNLNAVYMVDLTTNTVTGNIPVGTNPQNIVLSPDGSRLYVTNQGSNNISVINTANNNVTNINAGTAPSGIAISLDGTRVYVSNQTSNNVTIINTADNSVVATIPVGSSPTGLAVTPDGTLVYVTNNLSNDVSVINVSSNTVTATFSSDNLGGHGPINDFITGPAGCAMPFNFTITVLPTPPAITATGYLLPLTTTAGVPSATNSFKVTGTSLPSGIVVAPPNGFEVSTDGINFSNTLTVGTGGNIDSTTVYVRLAGAAPVGQYSGDIKLSSGTANATEATAPSTVTNAVPTVILGRVSGIITTCAGTPSYSPNIQQFSVTAVTLNGVVSVKAPDGFEVSLAPDQGYAVHVDVTNLDASGKSVIYVRASSTASGAIYGSVLVGSPGATTQMAAVSGVAYLLPAVNPVASQTVSDGNVTQAVAFTGTNANTFNWTNDQPGIGLAASGGGNIASFTAINKTPSPIVAHITVTPLSTTLAYVANEGSSSVSIINVANNVIVGSIKVGTQPQLILPNLDGSRIYVVNNGDNTMSVINTATNAIIATAHVGQGVTGLLFSADGTLIYTFNDIDETVSEISIASNTLVATVDRGVFGKATPNTVFSADGSRAYEFVIDVYGFYVSNTITGKNIGFIGGANRTPTSTQSLVLTPDGKYIYVSNATGNTIDIYDVASITLINSIPVPKSPQGLLLSNDGSLLYVANGDNNTISIINMATNKITSTLNAGAFPFSLALTNGAGCVGVPSTFTITVNPPVPTLNVSGTLDALTTVYGTPSPATSFTVSGTNLTEQITITPPNGFEISTDGINYASTLTVGGTANVPPTTIYIRLGAGTPVGTYNGDILVQSLGATDVKCPTAPVNTVLPPSQTILITAVTGSIAACQGSASASPFIQQFSVTGKLLTDNITLTAPVNFEISLDPASGYTSQIILPAAGGTVNATTVYVRSNASALGSIAGSVSLKSSGAVPKYANVKGNVTFTPTVNKVNNQVVVNGNLTAAVKFTGTGNTYNWVNNTSGPSIGLAASGGGNIPAFTAINTTSMPVTATITVTPVSASLAYIANNGSNSISVINTQTNQVVGNIPIGTTPYATVISPDGAYIYVANQQDGTISKVSAVSGQVTTIPAGQGVDGITISPDGSYVFTANGTSNDVSVVNTVTGTVFKIPVGIGPKGIVISPDGSTLYVICQNDKYGVYVIDLSSFKVVNKLSAQASPEGVAISPDGGTLYVTNYNSKSVSVINLATSVTVNVTVGVNPLGVSVSPDGKTLYVSNIGSNAVTVINTADNSIITNIPVGKGPEGVSVSPDGTLVYVANALGNTVSVISTASNKVVSTINVGSTPVSLGNFVSTGLGCAGIPTTFTITVNPFMPSAISSTGISAGLTTIYGTPSVSATINVSGTGLTAGISVTPPTGFEVSADGIKFNSTIVVGGPGNTGPIPVYIRLAATTPVGKYLGAILLRSAGATDVQPPMLISFVTTTPLKVTADNKTQVNGAAQPVFTATYTGFVNGEGPSVLTTLPSFVTTATVLSPAGKYPITVSGALSPNYSITYVPGILIITTTGTTDGQTPSGLVIPNTFTPNGDGINDTWNIPGLLTYTDFTVQIFNRTGQAVYFSNNYPTAWDGTYNGAYLPVGTYYYVISFAGTKPIGGSVTIIR